VQAAKHGSRIEGGTIYTTASPCWPCFKLVASAGISTVVFGELYRDPRIFDFAKMARIELIDLSAFTQLSVGLLIHTDEEFHDGKCERLYITEVSGRHVYAKDHAGQRWQLLHHSVKEEAKKLGLPTFHLVDECKNP
jgi:deoxycytidylate deaminase